MKISAQDISKLGNLARLKLSDKEITQYRSELGGILNYVDQLAQAPLRKILVAQLKGGSLRSDHAKPWPEAEREAAFMQAPDIKNKQLKVKRILA